MMKTVVLAAGMLLLIVSNVLAQLSGQLKDDTGNALGFANVAVLQARDSSGVTGAITDVEGRFSIPSPAEGLYMLRISAIGFVTQYVAPFQVNSKSFRRDFGTLVLQENVKLLGEVTVKALRPKITIEADKMVVSVEGTALASGSTAYEVLEKSPGVWVDQEGNIQLNGKAGVRIMINGRPAYLSGKELQSMLEGVSAEHVKNIEVITNPSARYEAAGSAGIINIQLKQNSALGMNGSIYGGYQYNNATGYSAGANLNYKKGNWNSYVNADMAERPRLREGVMIREFHGEGANARFHQLRDESVIMKTPSLRLGTDYELNARHSLGAMVNLSQNNMDRAFYSDTHLNDEKKGEHVRIKAGNFNDIENNSTAFNLHYNGLLDTVGTSLALNVDYIQLNNQNDARYENNYTIVGSNIESAEVLRSDNPGYYDIYSANADLTKKVFEGARLELGAKASYVVSGNALDFYMVTPEKE